MEDRIALMRDDPAVDLTVDGNAIAGVLAEVFGTEVTASEERCSHCGTVSLVGTFRVYMRGPGIVVRCPSNKGLAEEAPFAGSSRRPPAAASTSAASRG